MISHADENAVLVIESRRLLGNITLHLRCKGSAFAIDDIESHLLFGGDSDNDQEKNAIVHKLVNDVFWDRLSIRNNRGANTAQIHVVKSTYSAIINTLLAMVGGVLLGIFLKSFTSESFMNASVEYVFNPIFFMIMNFLKLMIGPLVFCSIASSIAGFTDLKALGKIAGKVVAAFLITSAIAIVVGYLVSFLLPAGNPNLIAAVGDQAKDLIEIGNATDVSIVGVLVSIVPLDIISPFQNSDMLNLIYMAVILGIVGSALSEKCPGIKTTMSTLNKICTTIVGFAVKLIPLMVICSMARMMIPLDFGALKDIFSLIPFMYLACIAMFVVYFLLLIFVGHVNPLKFFKKFLPAILTAFSTNSSSATLPTSFQRCDALGISRNVSSFSLPLGATINMDGSCIGMILTSFFMAGIYGVTIDGTTLTALFLTTLVLSVGSPGIPGAGMICMTILFPQVGVPAEAVAIILGIYPLLGMVMATANITGDAVVTTIVAGREKLLDMEKYNS